MKVVVTGMGGQLALEFKALKGLDSNWTFLSKNELDITNRILVLSYFKSISCDLIINCAAYTSVDNAEENKELAFKVNAEGTKNLLDSCELIGSKFIHYSTDYVFDGNSKIPYNELDPSNPYSLYGLSKCKGEKYILENKKIKSIILRTSWLYSSYGKNFVKTMIKLGREKNKIGIVADQFGSPTYANDLAKDTLKILSDDNYQWINGDIFHYSNNGFCTWFDFAKKIFEYSNNDVYIKPLSSKEYPAKVLRPKYSLLDKTKFERTFNIKIRDWEISLSEMLKKGLAV